MKKTILYFVLATVSMPLAAQVEDQQTTDQNNAAAEETQAVEKKTDGKVPWMYRPVEKPLRRNVEPEQPRMTLEERNQQDIDDSAKDTDYNLLRAALRGWHVGIGAGFEIGGISPLPLPRSIRKLNSFNPLLNFYIEGLAHKSFTKNWGMAVGLRFETKGMKTDATVKNYHMKITETSRVNDPITGQPVNREQVMEGGWTGSVVTKVHNSYLTIPLLATYTFNNERWTINTGPYISFLIGREFSGHVYDGYIRTSSNQEGKAYIPDEEGENVTVTYATYEFSDDMRTFAWGWQLGASFQAFRHFFVNVNLDWGLNSIFPSDFKTITFKMYPIYGNLGFSYRF